MIQLDHSGPEGEPLDTPSLRRALDLYTGAEHMYLKWHMSPPTPQRERLPPLPPTRERMFGTPKPLRLKTLLLGMLDPEMHDDATMSDRAPVKTDRKFQPLIMEHLHQLLPVVAIPTLEELDVSMQFSDSDVAIRHGFSVFLDAVEEMRWEGLTRLSYMGIHDVDSRKQVSESWVCISGMRWRRRGR